LLATACRCCGPPPPPPDECVPYFITWDRPNGGGGRFGVGVVPASRRIITVPGIYSLPVTVQFTTELDDGLVINGTRISTFGVIPPAFCMNERTFEAAVVNDLSDTWGADGEFCFTRGCNPLP
jgi:hypothetical protein